MAEPTSLFLAAALTTGFVEGASVLGFHRRALLSSARQQQQQQQLLQQTAGNSFSDNTNNTTSKHVNTVATIPSVSMLAAHAILYGIVSVPLGLVGASPGIAFLPSSFTTTTASLNDNKVAPPEENITFESGQRAVDENDGHRDHSNPSPTIISTTSSDIHGNRNLGWALRQENSKKISSTHNKWTRPSFSDLEPTSSMHHKMKPSTTPTSSNNSSIMQNGSNRYIATLDGTPLPTPLAESMRRARCLFIGAGLISYVITRYYLDGRQHQQHRQQQMMKEDAEMHYPRSGTSSSTSELEFGYNQWINTKSVNLWNERIQNGKSVNDYGDLFNKLLLQNCDDEKMSHRRGYILPNFLPNTSTTNNKALETMLDGMSKAIQLVKLQFERYTDTIGDATKTTNDEQGIVTSVEEEMQPAKTTPRDKVIDGIEASARSDLQSPPPPPPQQQQQAVVAASSNSSWSGAVVITVDVLGTSIRHLFESSYRLVSYVARIGRRRSASSGTATTTSGDNSQISS